MSMKMTMAEFVGLELCPFCKGEAFYNPGYNGGNVECRECGAEGAYKPTEAEAIAAWNTRVDYHGYEQAAIEAWESIKAWNSRAERTCKIIEWYEARDRHEIGNNRVRFSCGDFGTCHDKFCPECGARVVGK